MAPASPSATNAPDEVTDQAAPNDIQVDPTDPKAVWGALLQRVARQRSLVWLRFLEIDHLDEGRVTLRTLPGHREVVGFCTEERLQQIGSHLAPILGRRVRVALHRPEATSKEAGSTGNATEAPSGPRGAHRREAMNLPLVQLVMENFPDATLVDARDESELPTPPSNTEAEPDDSNDADMNE